MPVENFELAGSPTLGYQNGEYVINRKTRFDWANADAFAAELAPPSQALTQVPGAEYPGNSAFRVESFSMEPLVGDEQAITSSINGVNQYEWGVAEIEYRVPKAPTNDDDADEKGDPVPFLTHNMSSGGQFLSRNPGSGLLWPDGSNTSQNVSAGQWLPNTQHTLQWPKVLNPNWSALEGLKGHVNNGAFRLRGFDYPSETVLYLGYDATETVLTNGTLTWSFTLKFSCQVIDDRRVMAAIPWFIGDTVFSPIAFIPGTDLPTNPPVYNKGGWNHFWRSEFPSDNSGVYSVNGFAYKFWDVSLNDVSPSVTPGWYRLSDIDGFNTVYKPSANFGDLFLQGV